MTRQCFFGVDEDSILVLIFIDNFVTQVSLIDNFTNKKGMTSHCYRIAYRSMERSLTDEEINDLQVFIFKGNSSFCISFSCGIYSS